MTMEKGHFLRSFIPQKMPDRLVLIFLRFLSVFSFIGLKTIRQHYEENKRILSTADFFMRQNTFIEDQALWGKVKFGTGKHGNMAYSGCEVIAVFNALIAIKRQNHVQINEGIRADMMCGLIEAFERRGVVRRGEFGVAPTSIRDYLKRNGLNVRVYDKKEIADDKGNKNENMPSVFIATFYNHALDITEQIHTVCITKEKEGFFIHNSYNRGAAGTYDKKPSSDKGYEDLSEVINNLSDKEPKLIYLLGIS